MDWHTMSDLAIQKEIGRRFKELRLRHNVTQEDLAEQTMVSVNRIKALENGKGKLETIIMVLRNFNALDELENLIPDPGISPLALAELQGRKRVRASKKISDDDGQESSEW
jgi:transcriptional regulator with XRE-family HTH domain